MQAGPVDDLDHPSLVVASRVHGSRARSSATPVQEWRAANDQSAPQLKSVWNFRAFDIAPRVCDSCNPLVLLFLIQTRLVAMRRIDLHRRLGIVAAVIATLVVLVGGVAPVRWTGNGLGFKPRMRETFHRAVHIASGAGCQKPSDEGADCTSLR